MGVIAWTRYISCYSAKTGKVFLSEPGERSRLSPLLILLERRARDAAREIACRPDSPLRSSYVRGVHARMPLPSGPRLLQQSGIQAFRGLLHERRCASYFCASPGATICGDVVKPWPPAGI